MKKGWLAERRAARSKARVLAMVRAEAARQVAKSPPVPYSTKPGDWRGAGS